MGLTDMLPFDCQQLLSVDTRGVVISIRDNAAKNAAFETTSVVCSGFGRGCSPTDVTPPGAGPASLTADAFKCLLPRRVLVGEGSTEQSGVPARRQQSAQHDRNRMVNCISKRCM